MVACGALLGTLLAAVTLAGCQEDATPDPFVGPSELGLSLTLSASPDVLPLDGASQSLVTIYARDGSSQPIPNVSLRLQTRFGGVLQDLGQLSARTLVTGQDGRALATYTAPLGGSVDGEAQVELLVTPVGENFASAVPRTLAIRLVPSGFVTPPATFSAGFRLTPTSPGEFESALFSTTCLSENDTDCVRDPAAQVVSYTRDFGDGSTGSGSTVTHAFSTPSTYTVTLTVLDEFGRAAAATRSVTVVTGTAPTAIFALSPTGPSIDETVFFNASDSTASAGRSIATYSWTFGDGRTASGVTVSHDYDVAGTYNVTLTVTDNRGASDSTSSSVIVVTGAPTVSFVFSPSAPATGAVVRFDAVASSPAPGRSIVSYDWNFGDGSTATGVTTSHSFATAGAYNVTLTVTDNEGVTNATSSTVTVTTSAPTASFVFSPVEPGTTTVVQFNAVASSATPGRSIASYVWNFGDGSTATGVTTTHTFATAGKYNVTLTVTDSDGQTATTSSEVEVT